MMNINFFDELKAQSLKDFAQRFVPNEATFRKAHNRAFKLAQKFGDPGPEMARIDNFTLDHMETPISVRLYIPETLPASKQSQGPCHLYFHGGGFVVGSMDTHDGLCRLIANEGAMRVLSVDYRLAPKYPFPAALRDCEAALLYALNDGHQKGIDGQAISIGGDSAGGNLAAYLAQKYRRDLAAQILLYPLMQLAQKHPTNMGWQDSLMLGYVALNYIEKAYVAGADVHDVRLSPLFEKNLEKLPPAFVMTCELDPLRDEGRAYADMLKHAGNKVSYSHINAVPHGFLNFPKAFPAARAVTTDIAAFLRAHFQAG